MQSKYSQLRQHSRQYNRELMKQFLKPQLHSSIRKILNRMCNWEALLHNPNPLAFKLFQCLRLPNGLIMGSMTDFDANTNYFCLVRKFTNPEPIVVDELVRLDLNLGKDSMTQFCRQAFSSNRNPKAVEYLLSHLDKVQWRRFSSNPAEAAVDFLLAHPEHIVPGEFVANPHDRAVSWVLEHVHTIDMEKANLNPNPRMVQFLLDHPQWIDLESFSQNPCDLAVDYCLPRLSELESNDWMTNDNPRILSHVFERVQSGSLENVLSCPHIFRNPFKVPVVHIWTHQTQSVIYRLPLELVKMICDFV